MDGNYRTVLLSACANGHRAVAELLIHKGASINYQDKLKVRHIHSQIKSYSSYIHFLFHRNTQAGFTPLHYASQNGHTDIVELLIDHGAHIDVPTKVQVTAHHMTSYI